MRDAGKRRVKDLGWPCAEPGGLNDPSGHSVILGCRVQ